MAALFAQIDGNLVSITDCDWVLWGKCGCPCGVTVARYSVTEDDAWRAFYGGKRAIDRARHRGEHLELMTHTRWCLEVADRMKVRCTHA